MAIYVDDICEYPGKGQWCHMWTDGADWELDVFAARLGLRKGWAHLSGGVSGRFYHYDLRPSKRELALNIGAIHKPLKEWIKEHHDFSKLAGVEPGEITPKPEEQ